MKTSFTRAACAFTLSVVSFTAIATLNDSGDGLILDTDLNISCLKNANLAASNTFGISGIATNGTMNWSTAQNWIAAMNTANYLGYPILGLRSRHVVTGRSVNAHVQSPGDGMIILLMLGGYTGSYASKGGRYER